MRTTILKPVILITEGRTDAPIICSLINTGERKVYMVPAGGFQRIASTLRTQYLMNGDSHYYIAVFDSDSEEDSEREERLAMVRNLSKASYHQKHIGIFCFRNNLEKELGITVPKQGDKAALIQQMVENKDRMMQSKTIVEIQRFIDSFSD